MNEAIKLLFEEKYGDKQLKLFANRLDLANCLLKDNESAYYLNPEEQADVDNYNKHLNRLQSYISQIFSGSGTRKITHEFTSSLEVLITKKLSASINIDSKQIFDSVVKSLESINSKQSQDPFLGEFISDFKNSNYSVVFTSRPLELEANPNEIILAIRNTIVDSISNYFLGTNSIKQKLRYNFPNHHLCILFWRRVSYLVIKKLEELKDGFEQLESYMNKAYIDNPNFKENFKINLTKHNIKLEVDENKSISKKLLVHHFFAYINEKAIFQVFESREPNFMIPYIILNPNESNNIKGYIFLDNSNNSIELYKHGNRDLTVWKEKVWDTIKVNRNTKEISYIESIEDNVVLNFV